MKTARDATPPRPTARLDKWLWQARFFRTRTVCAQIVGAGHVRVNGVRTVKPGHAVTVGDALTFVQGNAVRVVQITALGDRRGPASEAQQLYRDLPAGQTAAPSPLE